MKTILLMRHAKADRPDGYATDFERPLAPRGIADSLAIGAYLATRRCVPGLVLCSSARRTRETWTHVAADPTLAGVPVEYRMDLYEASTNAVISAVCSAIADVDLVLVVGHEPTMSRSLQVLTGTGPAAFATGCVAAVRFDSARSWAECDPDSGRLEFMIDPRSLR